MRLKTEPHPSKSDKHLKKKQKTRWGCAVHQGSGGSGGDGGSRGSGGS